jgi:hypothetical protein
LPLSVWRRRSAWWLMPLIAMALMLVKMTNLVALIAVALFVILTEATAPIRSTRQRHGVPADFGPDAVAVECVPVNLFGSDRHCGVGCARRRRHPTSTSALALDHVTHASGADTGVLPANDQATEITGYARGWPTHSPAVVLTRWRANTYLVVVAAQRSGDPASDRPDSLDGGRGGDRHDRLGENPEPSRHHPVV